MIQVEIELEECLLHLEDLNLQHICNHWNGFSSRPTDITAWLCQIMKAARRNSNSAQNAITSKRPAKGLFVLLGHLHEQPPTTLQSVGATGVWKVGGLCFCVLGLEETILLSHLNLEKGGRVVL